MTDRERRMIKETREQLSMSNLPRECKALLRYALNAYEALIALDPNTWRSSEWRDPYATRSWRWIDPSPDVEREQATTRLERREG